MILADGLLGQMMEPIVLPEPTEPDLIDKPWALTGHGNARPHNIINSLALEPQVLEDIIVLRHRRYEQVKASEQRAECYRCEDAQITVVAYGATARVARSAVNKARAEGIAAGLIRPITLWPYPEVYINQQIDISTDFLVSEMSMGQMVEDVRLVVNGRRPVHFLGHTGGMTPTPEELTEAIRRIAAGQHIDLVPFQTRLSAQEGVRS